ncbi:MAG: CPBP family intramembrane metalloprotease [Alkalibacterium sp.]|nr:CPBP family intramembrane metalloprotease [Alkalibacterium sp.]
MNTDMNQVSLKVIFGVSALALGVSYFLTVSFLPELQGYTMLFTAFLIDLSFFLAMLLITTQQLKKGNVNVSAIFGKREVTIKKGIPAALLILLNMCVVVLGVFFIIRLMLLTQTGSALTLEFLMEIPVSSPLSPLTLALRFIITVICAPIVEEILFRGVLLNKLALTFGIRKGILFSSIIFMVFHLNSFFIPQLIGGILLGIIYIKTKQLIYPILAHALNNLIPFLLNFMPDGDTPEVYIDMSELITALNILSLVFFVVLIIFIIATVKYAKQISNESIPYRFNYEMFG